VEKPAIGLGGIMRRFSLYGSLALAALSALTFGMSGARAESVQQVFEKYNLIGTWAWDCSKPPDRNNWVFINRAVDANTVQRDYMKSATERGWYATLTQATALGPTEVRVAGTRDGHIKVDGIWRVEANRMFQWEATQDGKKTIANGRYVAGNGAQLQALNKCGASGQHVSAPANTQAANVPAEAAGPNTPGHVVTVSSGQKMKITTHMSYDRQCKPARILIQVVSKPANGTLAAEPTDFIVPPSTPGGGQQQSECVGRKMPGVTIFYQSRPGFTGQDSFTYRRVAVGQSNDPLNRDYGYTISVK